MALEGTCELKKGVGGCMVRGVSTHTQHKGFSAGRV